jgi:hypothetical protein
MIRSFFTTLVLTVVPVVALAASVPTVEISGDVHHDISPAVRDLPQTAPSAMRVMPWRRTSSGLAATLEQPLGLVDEALQTRIVTPLALTGGINELGVGTGFTGPQGTFTVNSAPPDTNGAVGDTEVVEWVNSSFAVFNKTTGAILQGPIAGNALWKGFGGGCETNNDGDPVVLFDKAAHRWIFTQFSVSTTPFLQCVAVSTTNDATGTFFRYAFTQPNFNDYPKVGTWTDAFYISFNIFNGNTFVGPRACAFDRAKMLTGAAATQQCFQLASNFSTILPSDLDGATAPPTGSPNFFTSFGTNSLLLWAFHSDFVTPANATFTGPTTIPVAAFTPACGATGVCIPQSGVTQKLDSLSDRLMFRLAYRNFPNATPPHESLVVNHTIVPPASTGAVAAVRWYEIRSPHASPTVFQQGTFAPDSTSRWMGSAAMDKQGNMAVGYSASSSAIHPAIRLTGRLATDPLGTLEAEATIFAGAGSQSGQKLSRWGDYTSISIDPADDCTFWYFNEYEPATGAFNWATRIASFKFSGCV